MSNLQLTGNWNYPNGIRAGAGRIAELPEILDELNGHAAASTETL